MKLEILLSVMNLNKQDLDKMNITSKCTVINQCKKNNTENYKNFSIYSYNEIGLSVSRNRGLEHVTEDIILISDNDIVYNKDYEKMIIEEFENNPKADLIIFNVDNPTRGKRLIKKRKRLFIFNSLNYASCNIAFRRKSIEDKNIKFNTKFGPGAKFGHGSDTIFLRDIFKKHLKVYSSPYNIGKIYPNESTWFKGYNEDFFFKKGALFTAINPKIRHILLLQFLIRHKEVFTDIKFMKAYKIMLQGSKKCLDDIRSSKCL